jgi:hypothetical protein
MTPELQPLPDDVVSLDESYPALALADQVRAYAAAAVAAALEQQAAEIERLRDALGYTQGQTNQAVTENEALRKGAERYEWIRAGTSAGRDSQGFQQFNLPFLVPQDNLMRGSVAQHLDKAIDAAMKENPHV